VIECLQYAATGKQPKNTKKGAAFVHDLKLVDGNTVNAKVRTTRSFEIIVLQY